VEGLRDEDAFDVTTLDIVGATGLTHRQRLRAAAGEQVPNLVDERRADLGVDAPQLVQGGAGGPRR
jgi:hypothetical protein